MGKLEHRKRLWENKNSQGQKQNKKISGVRIKSGKIKSQRKQMGEDALQEAEQNGGQEKENTKLEMKHNQCMN